jgi:hypothetical protein
MCADVLMLPQAFASSDALKYDMAALYLSNYSFRIRESLSLYQVWNSGNLSITRCPTRRQGQSYDIMKIASRLRTVSAEHSQKKGAIINGRLYRLQLSWQGKFSGDALLRLTKLLARKESQFDSQRHYAKLMESFTHPALGNPA